MGRGLLPRDKKRNTRIPTLGVLGRRRLLPCARMELLLQSNEENKYLYVVTGSETFDWESLCHYEVWKNRKVIYY